MERAGAIIVALALLLVAPHVQAECLSVTDAVECGGVLFEGEHLELDDGVLVVSNALAVLPDGRVILARTLTTECRATCLLSVVTLSGHPQALPTVRVGADGVTSGSDVIATFGSPARAGLAAVEVRIADEAPTTGVGVIVPVDDQRAAGAMVAAGPDAVGLSAQMFLGAHSSSRLDFARVYGRTGYLVSAAERLSVGPLMLSLDGTLGNGDGRAFFAGSQRHYGRGREELVVGLTAGDSDGMISLRYVASRAASEKADEVLLDGVVQAEFGAVEATLEIGAGARAASDEFSPSLGTALTLEAPLVGQRWLLTPRISLRVVGEQAEALRDDATVSDATGLATGVSTEVTPLADEHFELRFVADGSYGAVLASGQPNMRAWNTPLDGWRAVGGIEIRAGRGTLIRWLAERRQAEERGAYVLAVNLAGEHGWGASQIRFNGEGFQGAWAVVGASSGRVGARLAALQGEEGRQQAPILGRQPLRRSVGDYTSDTALAMGVVYRSRLTLVEAEATYSTASVRGARFGGVGRATLQLPGRSWGVNGSVGSLVGRGDIYASVGVQLGRHPGISGWHQR